MYDFKHIYEAESVKDAITLMKEHPEAKLLAGGSDLLIQMRGGLYSQVVAISIYGLDELRGVSMDENGTICIRPLTSFTHIERNEIVKKYIGVLGVAVSKVGGPQIRNIGSIGGNVCNGHTGADSGSTLVALDAQVEITDEDGIHIVPINEFYKPTGGVDLKPAQIVTGFLFPKESYEGYYGAHYKYSMRNAMDVDAIGCSLNIKLSEDKKCCEDVRCAFGVMGPIPARISEAEDFLRGKELTEENIQRFADIGESSLSPRTDYRATKEFRSHMAHVMIKRTLAEATEMARKR